MRERVRLRDLGVVLVVALVALAGCNGLAPGGPAGTPTETVTAVPIESPTATATATPVPSTFAWLVAGEGVAVDDLYESHISVLSNRSFTLVWTRQTVGGSGPIAASYDRRIAVVNDSTYSRRATGSATDGVVRTFSDPSGLYRQVEAANGSRQNFSSPDEATNVRAHYALLGASTVDLHFVGEDARVRYVEREGTRYAQLFSTTAPDYLDSVYTEYDVSNFTATVWVHPDRYIRTVYYEYTLADDGERMQVGERFTYTAVGETTLDQPPWVEALRVNRSTTPTNGTATPANGTVTPTNGTATPTSATPTNATGTPGNSTSTSGGSDGRVPPGDASAGSSNRVGPPPARTH